MNKKIFYLLILFIFIYNLYPQQPKIQEGTEEISLQEIEIKEGQTLAYIANYYLKDPKRWPEILKYNKLAISDIYAPLPGMKIKVPIYLVKEKFRPAYLVYILNKVQYRKKDTVEWKDAFINMELYNDDSLTTYENSRANIKFYSGEILSIDENSFITIRPELKQEEVTLLKGGIRATKAKVLTEHAEILPRIDPKTPKNDFKAKIRPEDKTTLVEVYEGAVDVTAQGKTVYVPKGFGTEVKPFSPPSLPKALPPPPEFTLKSENLRFTAGNELVLNKNISTISFQFVEPKIETLPTSILPSSSQQSQEKKKQQTSKVLGSIIKKYHLQISKEPEFKKVIYEEIKEIKPNESINLDLKLLNLPDGKYYYKLSYIDELGFENPAAPQSFIIDTTPPQLFINLPDQQPFKTDQEIITINGQTEPQAILKINERDVKVEEDGKFSVALLLRPGLNNIQFIAKDYYGNETNITRQVEYVKKLTKEEKDIKSTTEEITQKETFLGKATAFLISAGIIVLVIMFFIK